MATMLDVVRTALRRTSKALDDAELKPLIEAAKLDLKGAGVDFIVDSDPLIQAAVRLFVLYNIERDEKEFEFYTNLKQMIATNGEYIGEGGYE